MKKYYIEPKAIYIDLQLEGYINDASPSDTTPEEGDPEDYTKQQGTSDIWKNWGSDSDK